MSIKKQNQYLGKEILILLTNLNILQNIKQQILIVPILTQDMKTLKHREHGKVKQLKEVFKNMEVNSLIKVIFKIDKDKEVDILEKVEVI